MPLRLVAGLIALSWALTAWSSDFTLPTADEGEYTLSDHRGEWVVVNFWATWCPPCLEEMPELDAFHQAYAERGWSVVGINYEPLPAADIQTFLKARFDGVSFPIALSDAQDVEGFEIMAMPTTFIVSPDGNIVSTHLGQVTKASLELTLKELGATLSP